MNRSIEAIFDNGVFRPVEAVHLAQGERVRVTLPSPATAPDPTRAMIDDSRVAPDRAAALQRLVAYARTHSFTSTRPYPTREELHEREP